MQVLTGWSFTQFTISYPLDHALVVYLICLYHRLVRTLIYWHLRCTRYPTAIGWIRETGACRRLAKAHPYAYHFNNLRPTGKMAPIKLEGKDWERENNTSTGMNYVDKYGSSFNLIIIQVV